MIKENIKKLTENTFLNFNTKVLFLQLSLPPLQLKMLQLHYIIIIF